MTWPAPKERMTIVRDTFLVFLLVIATAALGGSGWCGYRSVRDDGDGGCLLLILALVLLGIGSTLLTAVGHVVGVSIPHLGW
jgi:hypothetical protein